MVRILFMGRDGLVKIDPMTTLHHPHHLIIVFFIVVVDYVVVVIKCVWR